MLYPSIDEMMKKVDSKYSLVVGGRQAGAHAPGRREVARRRRPKSHKLVGVALEEIYHDLLQIEQDRNNAK